MTKTSVQSFQINTLSSIETAKGKTLEWCKGIPGQQVSIYWRNKASSFANHWHSGLDPSKKPERFLLLQGKVEFSFIDKFRDLETTQLVVAGQEVLIEPYVYHSAQAITDCLFIEYRAQPFSSTQDDCFSWEDYQALAEPSLTSLALP